MTNATKRAARLAAIPAAALAALLLAGCSATHVGDAWQCPLPKGGACGSVAETDPAVPDAGGRTVLGGPLWQARGSGPAVPGDTVCTADCGGGFDPFGWLARLFADRSQDGETQPPDPVVRSEERAAESVGAALPGEPAPVGDGPAREDPASDDLRTEEVVARIWIAPFVDADGVYREASHVRVVLEPAGWRVE